MDLQAATEDARAYVIDDAENVLQARPYVIDEADTQLQAAYDEEVTEVKNERNKQEHETTT